MSIGNLVVKPTHRVSARICISAVPLEGGGPEIGVIKDMQEFDVAEGDTIKYVCNLEVDDLIGPGNQTGHQTGG